MSWRVYTYLQIMKKYHERKDNTMPLNKKNQWFMNELKMKRFAEDIKPWRFKKSIDVEDFTFLELESKDSHGPNPEPPKEGWEVGKLGQSWGSLDTYMWVKANVKFPKEWTGGKVVGIFDFGKALPGMQIGAETLLYINDLPYKGVDSNHSEAVMPEDLSAIEAITFRCWTGVPNKTRYEDTTTELNGQRGPIESIHKISQMSFGLLDEKVDSFYWDIIAVENAVTSLKDRQPAVADRLMAGLQKAYALIDPVLQEEAYRECLYTASEALKEAVKAIGWETDLKYHAIGQSHIDLAWLWRTGHTREKIARTFSTALRMMEAYPDYIYMQSQPQLLAWLKEDYPTIYEGLKERIAQGRFEVDGAMWLECDCNIPSGESFTRQILYGKKFMKEEFGVNSTYLWMPDVFGYSWALPQILRKSGVDTFCTTKMAWNKYNRMPFQTFNWRGIDGTEVLTHLIEDVDYTQVTAENMCKGFEKYEDRDVSQTLISPFGFGDGGGGPTTKDMELLHRFDEMPGMPSIETGTISAYFKDLHNKVQETESYVHTWDGELYLELHRGTLTSQAFTKKYNRNLEFALGDLEKLEVMACLEKGDFESYLAAGIEGWWKKLLLNQFHDIIPGSSISEVYDDAKEVYEEVTKGVALRTDETVAALTYEADKISVFNGSGWTMEGYTNIDGQWAYVEGLEPLTFSEIPVPVKESEGGFTFSDSVLETPFYSITFGSEGRILSLYDKEAGREAVKAGGSMNRLVTYEDRPLEWNAWDVDAYYRERSYDVDNLKGMTFEVKDGHVGELHLTYGHMASEIKQTIRVYKKSRRIDFVMTVDWHENERLLRVLNDVAVRGAKATYDIQYGNCERSVSKNTSWEFARFEVAAHKWMDLSEYGYGMALLNDCKYGHDVTDSTMGLTLIKSGVWPDPMADQGQHSFTYALLPHMGDWRQGAVEKEAWLLNNPLKTFKGKGVSKSIFRPDNDGVEVDAVKLSEDKEAVILRLHEYKGGSTKVSIRSDYGEMTWVEADLLENPMGSPVTSAVMDVAMGAYEIKTFRVNFK